MGKLANILGLFALATLLAAGGFGGYLFASGHLNAKRMELIAGVLRGELDPNADPNAGAAPAPTSQPVPEKPHETSAQAAGSRRQREDLENLRLERARADVDAQRRLLDQALQRVVEGQEQIAAHKADMEKQAKAAKQRAKTASSEDEGFRKELELVKGLKAPQAKDYIVHVWNKQKADAVRLFSALDKRQSTKILEQFQSAEDTRIMADLLEQIRLQGQEGNALSSGRTAGAATP